MIIRFISQMLLQHNGQDKAIIYLKRVKQTVVTFVDNQWEKYRNESITWNKVDGAIKYAIYADGKLYITTDDENTTSISVPVMLLQRQQITTDRQLQLENIQQQLWQSKMETKSKRLYQMLIQQE